MEAALDCEPMRSYSWWWDSHISPKNSKWLQDNLTDMDNKIKAMIKLIEEDADSFARRAEMYYKKRPDLMKLVEEFYRAYRALAERYDHVTGALRQAHRTIAVAFPNEIQLMLPDEPPSGLLDTGEDTYESGMPTQSNATQWDGESLDEIAPFIIKEGLKHLNWLFADEEAQKKFGERLLKNSLNFKEEEGKGFECRKLEAEVLKLSKENKNLNKQITLESMRADRAEAELQTLKNAFSKLKSELEAAFLQYQVSQERISNLESEVSESQEELQHLNDEISIKVSKLNISEQRCIGLKRENTSLQLELAKNNQAVTRQEEEASGLLEENHNLHKRANSESKRADQAEAESIRLRDAISKLKSEMESALLQHNVSQGRISDLEAEISSSKEQFKNINDEMSIGASKLNMSEDQCLLLQEENKSLQHELEKFKQIVMRREEEMAIREEEFYKLKQFFEDECQRSMHIETREKSLQLQLNKLEQTVEKQEEELALREKELDKFKQQIEDERKQHLFTERVHQSLVDFHSQSEEKMRLFNLEFQNKTEKLRRMELRKAGLEEEIRLLSSENNVLNERNFSSVSKIVSLKDEIISLRVSNHKFQDELRVHAEEKMILEQELSSFKSKKNDLEEGHRQLTERLRRKELKETDLEEEMRHLHDENIGLKEKSFSKIVNLQDDIISLTESKYRLEDELQFHAEEKKILQQELYSLKNDRHDLEERHLELMEQMEEVNFNVISLQAVVKELHDGNKELKDICKKHENEKAFHLEQLRLMDSITQKNNVLNNSLSGADADLKKILGKLRELNEYSESFHGNVLSRMPLKPELCSYVEAATQNMEILSEKNATLGKNISDLDLEFEVLQGKLKALERCCQSFYHQKSYLIGENTNLVSQVERFGLHLQSLENRFLILEGKHVNIEEKDQAIHRTEELCGPIRLGKEQRKDHICYFRSQTGILGNQIHLLKEENKVIKAELEEEQYKTVESEFHGVIMEQFINDLTEKNMFLSKECGKYMDKFKFAEKFILVLKEEWTSQEKKLIMHSDRNEKLLEGIHVTMKTLNTKKACETLDTKAACEISNSGNDYTLHLILHELAELRALVSVSKDEVHHFQLEKSVISTLLEQLALSLTELRAQKKVLEQESVLRSQEVFILKSKNNELMKINELSQSEVTRLLEVNKSLSKSLYELREQSDVLEEENIAILEKVITQEHLSLIFRSFFDEKSLEMEWLIRGVNSLYRVTNNLGQEIRVINKSMRTLEAENMHLKDEYRTHIVLVEDNIYKDRNAFGKLGLQTEAGKKMLKQIDMELPNAHEKLQNIQCTEMHISREGFVIEINKAKVAREELEKNKSISEDDAHKNCEIGCLHKSNEILQEELYKFHEVVEALKTREKNLTSELQISIDNYWSHKEEAVKLLQDLHVSSFMELIFKEKFIELMQTLNGLEKTDIMQSKMLIEDNALRNVQEEDLKEKLDALRRENKGLMAELNAYVPLIVSLEKEIASLEEHTLSLTNLHILNNKRKQGNLLPSLQRNKSSQIRGKHHSSKVSAGILELKKLRAKVKVLQKAATDTEILLEHGKVVSDTSMDSARKSKARKAKGSTGLVGAQKKKDIVLDLRKSDASGKDVKLLKDDKFSRGTNEQILKDIELDHVLSTSRCGVDFDVETALHNLEMWEPGTKSNIEYYQIEKMDVDRSENLSTELVLENELSVDNLLLPANYTEPLQEWIKRVSCSLSADAQRLLALEKSLAELKKNIEIFETKCQPSAPELSTVKLQVKEGEGAIMKLNDFNYKLTKMAENFSMSSDSHKNRRKILQRVQRGLEKISGLELKLQKVHHNFSKLQEEQHESKTPKPLERRSRIPLKDLIYGKKSDPRQMKRQFCACMRLKTK